MKPPKFLYLTTLGHKSGKAHEIEIWYVDHDGCYYLVSEKGEAAHWVRNIRANPVVSFCLGAQTYRGRASVPADVALIAAIKAKMDEKHGWSDGLVVGLCGEEA